MKHRTGMRKRCLAAVLALVTALASSGIGNLRHVHAADDVQTAALGDLIVSNYGSALNEKEQAIISSGLLAADEGISYIAPPAEVKDGGLIAVDEGAKLVTATAYTDGEGHTWVPVSFDIVLNEDVKDDDVALVLKGNVYEGTYTYEGNMFSVVVTYALDIEVDAAKQQKLLNASYQLAQDIALLQKLNSGNILKDQAEDNKIQELINAQAPMTLTAQTVLNFLTMKLPMLDNQTAVELIASLEKGKGFTVEIPGEEPITVEFGLLGTNYSKALGEEITANGGAFALNKFMTERNADSYMAWLLGYGQDLEIALDKTYTNLNNLANNGSGLPSIQQQIEELKYTVELLEADAWDAIAEEAQAYGYTEPVKNIDDIRKLIAYFDTQVEAVYTQINATLTAAGYGQVSSVKELEDLLTEVKAQKQAGIDAANEQLAAVNEKVTAAGFDAIAPLTDAKSVENLITKLESIQTQTYNKINESLNGTAYGPVASVTEVNEVISQLESIVGLVPSLSSKLEQAKQARDILVAVESVLPTLKSSAAALKDAEGKISQLQQAVDGLKQAETIKTQLNDAITQFEALEAGKAELAEKQTMLNMLVIILQRFCEMVEPVVDAFDQDTWNAPSVVNTAWIDAQDDIVKNAAYLLLNENAAGQTALGFQLKNPLKVATAPVQYNMSMFNVTVVADAQVVGEDNALKALAQLQSMFTFRAGATAAEIQPAIDQFVEAAKTTWAVIDSNYTAKVEKQLADLLDEGALAADITYQISFTPNKIQITYGDGFDTNGEEVYYGHKLTLPVGENGTAYSYTVDGQRKNQGEVIVITAPVTITREAGDASQYKTVTDIIANTNIVTKEEASFLQNAALNQGKTLWLVTPEDDSLVQLKKIEGSYFITADSVNAVLGNLVWAPVSAVTYDDQDKVLETLTFTGNQAAVTNVGYAKVIVNYELKITTQALSAEGIKAEDILAKMNLRDTLAKEYAQQKSGLEQLLTQSSNLAKIKENAGMLSTGAQLATTQAARDAIAQIVAQVSAEGDLLLYKYLMECDGANKDGKADNMLYFYQNDDAILEQVKFVLNLTNLILADEGLMSMLSSNAQYMNMFTSLQQQFANLVIPAVNSEILVTADNAVQVNNLLALIAAANGNTNTYSTVGEMVWTAQVEAVGAGSVKIPVTVTIEGTNVEKTSHITLALATAIEQSHIDRINIIIADLETAAEVDKKHYTSTVVSLEKGHVVDGNESIIVTWAPKTYTVENVDGEDADATVTYANREVTLVGPGENNTTLRYDYTYSYKNAEGQTITKVVEVSGKEQKHTFDLNDFDFIFANNDTITLTMTVVDAAREEIIEAVKPLTGSATLYENPSKPEGEKYALVLPISTSVNDTAADLGNFVMGLMTGGSKEVKLGEEVLIDNTDVNAGTKVYLQTLINAILNSGISSDNIINMKELVLDGFTPVAKTRANAVQLGGQLVKTTLSLDGKKMDLYITLSGDITSIQNALAKVSAYVSFVCEDGALNAEVTLPNSVYAVYLAALTMVGKADLHDINAVNNEIALGYLLTALDPALDGADVNLDTFTNTLANAGVNADLSAYNKYFETFKKYYDVNNISYTGDKATLSLENVMIKGLLDRLQTMVDDMLAQQNLPAGSIKLADMIVEYNTGVDAKISAKLTNTNTRFAALGVSISGFNVALATANNLSAVANSQYVILLDDIQGDLNLNAAVLDLNGKTVNGSIKGSVTRIVDNVYIDGEEGSVTGSVSATNILGGVYAADVSAMLPDGYVQDANGKVSNIFYTINKNGNETTVTLNPSTALKQLANRKGVINLAVELALDVVMNHYNAASLTVGTNKLVDINVNDIVDIVFGQDSIKNLLNQGLDSISAPAFAGLVNDLVAALTDFQGIADALNGNGLVYSADVTTSTWALELAHKTAENEFTFNLKPSNDQNVSKLNIVIDGDDTAGDMQEEIAQLFAALADTTTVTSNLGLEDIVLNGTSIVVEGQYEGHVVVDFTGDPDYAVMMAIILAHGTADAQLKSELISAINAYGESGWVNPSELKTVFEKISIAKIADALANTTRKDTVSAMVAELEQAGLTQVSDNLKNDTTAKGFDLALDVLGFILRRVDIANTGTLGGVDEPEYGTYFLDIVNRNFNGSVNIARGYSLSYAMNIPAISVTVKLFKVNEAPTIGDPTLKDDSQFYGWKTTKPGLGTEDGILWLDVINREGMTVSELKSLLEVAVTNDADDTAAVTLMVNGAPAADTDLVPTGATLELVAENAAQVKATGTWLVVVLGDTAGTEEGPDGRITSGDSVAMMNHYLRIEGLTGAKLLAAELNGVDGIQSGDAVQNMNKFFGTNYESILSKNN